MTSNYIFKNRLELMEATNLWRTDPTSAKATYGEMNTWDVSTVNDFSRLFYRREKTSLVTKSGGGPKTFRIVICRS